QQNHLNDLDSFTPEKGLAIHSWRFPGRALSLYERTFGGGSGSLGVFHLFSDVIFRPLELFGMGYAPFYPDGNQQCLEDPCDRRSEERTRDPKEFGPGDQRGKRDYGMQTNDLADDARPHDITHDHMHDDA